MSVIILAACLGFVIVLTIVLYVRADKLRKEMIEFHKNEIDRTFLDTYDQAWSEALEDPARVRAAFMKIFVDPYK